MSAGTELDRCVVAYREDPTDQNRQLLMLAQSAHFDRFCWEQTIEFQARTHR